MLTIRTVAAHMLVNLSCMTSFTASRCAMVDLRDKIRLAVYRQLRLVGRSRRSIDSDAATMSRICLSTVGRAAVAEVRRDVYTRFSVGWSGHIVTSFLLLVARRSFVWWLLVLVWVRGVGWSWKSRFGRSDGTSVVSGCLTTAVSTRLLGWVGEFRLPS